MIADTVFDFAVSMLIGMVAIIGFVYVARYFTYLAFSGQSPAQINESSEERFQRWLISIVLGAPTLFVFCMGAVWVGRQITSLVSL